MTRPNILFAIADDASHMSAYGHSFLETPGFDRVAAKGVLFTSAFTTNPKCAPSRASILTSRHTWQLEEACCHFGIFPAKFPVYPDLLEDAGYHVGFTGKGWSPGDWKRGGFARNPAGPEFVGRTLESPSATISPKDYAGNFEDFLADRPEGAPFCFWYGGHEPHRPYEPGEGLRGGKDIGTIPVPGYLPDDEIVKSDLADYAFEIEWFDSQLDKMITKLEAIGELDNTLIIVTSDNGMPFPRVKGQMYEDDYRLPLAICWPDRVPVGRVVADLVSFTDFAPTMLDAAGISVAADMVGRSLVGLLESDRGGIVEPDRDRVYMGRERHDMGREGDVGYPVRCVRTRDYLYSRNFKPDLWPAGNPETGFTNIDSSPTKTLILDQHSNGSDRYFDLAMGKRPAEELYAIGKDPECLHNLADDSAYADLKTELWADLEKTLEESGDPRVLGTGDVFDTYEYTGKCLHSWRNYVDGTWEPQPY